MLLAASGSKIAFLRSGRGENPSSLYIPIIVVMRTMKRMYAVFQDRQPNATNCRYKYNELTPRTLVLQVPFFSQYYWIS